MPVTDLTAPGLSLNSNLYADSSIFPPENPTIPPGKQTAPWTPPGWRTGTIDPSELGGGGGGGGGGRLPWWLSLLGNLNPIGRGAIAAGGILQPTPVETGELHPRGPPIPSPSLPVTANAPNLPYGPAWSGMPQSQPNGPGAAAPAVTTNQPSLPYGPAALPANTPLPPPRPVPMNAPMPPRRPVDRAKVARAVAMAAPSPMFVPITAPNSDPLNRNQVNPYRPQMSALNLSGLFGR